MNLVCMLLVAAALFIEQSAGKPPKPSVDPFSGKPIETKKEHSYEQVVVITGASSGIGYATALEFARDPRFKVYATMRSPEKWERPAEEEGVTWDNLVVLPLDVTNQESIRAAVTRVADEEDGQIDVVVNNAGYGLAACLEGAHVEEAMQLFDVNVWGPVRTLQEVLPFMRKNKKGHIINVSSTSGIRGIPCMEYYAGSKFALEGISDSMRFSLAAYNISVSMINAGPVRTKFTDVYVFCSVLFCSVLFCSVLFCCSSFLF
jgi:NADP-dependent 3-hydroxy acid dehydrogenase YdfG